VYFEKIGDLQMKSVQKTNSEKTDRLVLLVLQALYQFSLKKIQVREL